MNEEQLSGMLCARVDAARLAAELSPQQRRIFLAVVEYGRFGDAADALGADRGTAKCHLSRARSAVRRQLEAPRRIRGTHP